MTRSIRRAWHDLGELLSTAVTVLAWVIFLSFFLFRA